MMKTSAVRRGRLLLSCNCRLRREWYGRLAYCSLAECSSQIPRSFSGIDPIDRTDRIDRIDTSTMKMKTEALLAVLPAEGVGAGQPLLNCTTPFFAQCYTQQNVQ